MKKNNQTPSVVSYKKSASGWAYQRLGLLDQSKQ
jgi:hypothetical protein